MILFCSSIVLCCSMIISLCSSIVSFWKVSSEKVHSCGCGSLCYNGFMAGGQSEEGLSKIGKAAGIYGAPLAIIACADHNKAWVRPFDKKQTCDIDASILTDHMMLQATDCLNHHLPPVLCRRQSCPDHHGDTKGIRIVGDINCSIIFIYKILYSFQSNTMS